MTQEQKDALRATILKVKGSARISQIMVSRIVKAPRGGGDVFVSLTANYGSPDDEGGESEMLTLDEAKVAAHLLGKDVNILAHEQAAAGGVISSAQMERATEHIKSNFNHLVSRLGEK